MVDEHDAEDWAVSQDNQFLTIYKPNGAEAHRVIGNIRGWDYDPA